MSFPKPSIILLSLALTLPALSQGMTAHIEDEKGGVCCELPPRPITIGRGRNLLVKADLTIRLKARVALDNGASLDILVFGEDAQGTIEVFYNEFGSPVELTIAFDAGEVSIPLTALYLDGSQAGWAGSETMTLQQILFYMNDLTKHFDALFMSEGHGALGILIGDTFAGYKKSGVKALYKLFGFIVADDTSDATQFLGFIESLQHYQAGLNQ